MSRIYKIQSFSLIELIAVIAIIMLIAGITVTQLGRLPAFASLKNNAEQLKSLFISAGLRASSTGTPQTVIYSTTSRTFSVQQSSADEKNLLKPQAKPAEFCLSNGIQANFKIHDRLKDSNLDIDSIEDIKFTCYSDGLISGPNIELRLRKQRLQLHISPLTGAIKTIVPE